MHAEALTSEGAALFPLLSKFKNFYLVGGTALALQIGHRLSVDFDLFSRDELPTGLLQNTKRVFKDASLAVTYRSSQQINLLINEVKVTFFHFPYPVETLFQFYQKFPVSSVLEIAAMKAFAMGQRNKWKDYADLYFIFQHHSLQKIIDKAENLFGTGLFNSRLFREQLAYHVDISYDEEIEWMPGFEVPKDTILEKLIDISIS